jgi:hypothetical protein
MENPYSREAMQAAGWELWSHDRTWHREQNGGESIMDDRIRGFCEQAWSEGARTLSDTGPSQGWQLKCKEWTPTMRGPLTDLDGWEPIGVSMIEENGEYKTLIFFRKPIGVIGDIEGLKVQHGDKPWYRQVHP